MTYHKLLISDTPTASLDDMSVYLGEYDGEEVVYVPKDVAAALEHLQIRNAEEFASLLIAFPGVIASEIGWKDEQVRQVRSSVLEVLKHVVPPAIFNQEPSNRFLGVIRPPPPPQ